MGYIELGAGINETVNKLILNGVGQIAGTYGSTLSLATFKNDEYFSGTGILNVLSAGAASSLGEVPEPTTLVMLVAGFALLSGTRRTRR